MLFKNIAVADGRGELGRNLTVGTAGDRIEYISDKAPRDESVYGESYDGSGKLLLPAFYNAHTHLPMSLVRGYGENMTLMDWLYKKIFPFEDQLTQDDVCAGALLGVMEMLRFGGVSATEMYMRGDGMGRAFSSCGAKFNFSISCALAEQTSYYDSRFYREAVELKERYHGAQDGRLKTDLSLHAEYTNSERAARELAEASEKLGLSVQVHVSETAGEVEQCRARRGGRSPVRFLCDCGLFEQPTTAAHCVHVDAEDISILREKNVTVATCPKSNLKLASGVAPVLEMMKAGINVAVATDGVASNNNLNMPEEIKFFALVHKGVSGDPTAIAPAEALYCATRAGALAQGREDCGLVERGFKADLAVFDCGQVYHSPCYDLLANFVYSGCGTDCVLTMADGRVLYRDGEFPTIDREKTIRQTEDIRRRILKAIG